MKTDLPIYCSLAEIAHIIHRAGLWPTVPSRTSIYRWRQSGHIITTPGFDGRPVVHVASTLAKLKNPYI